jgi:hypothetical protein
MFTALIAPECETSQCVQPLSLTSTITPLHHCAPRWVQECFSASSELPLPEDLGAALQRVQLIIVEHLGYANGSSLYTMITKGEGHMQKAKGRQTAKGWCSTCPLYSQAHQPPKGRTHIAMAVLELPLSMCIDS